MPDPFRGDRQSNVLALPSSWKTIGPDDNTDLAFVPKALWVDGAGTLKMTGADGNAETFAVQAGYVPLCPTRIWNTGTTATGIKALLS